MRYEVLSKTITIDPESFEVIGVYVPTVVYENL